MKDWNDIISDYRSYLRIERALSKNTLVSYTNDIMKLARFMSYRNPEDINGEDLAAFISDEAGKNISKRSQARTVSSLKSFFSFLEIEGRIMDNPADINCSLH